MKREFVTIEKYKGEEAGQFAKVWIAADIHGQFYMTHDLEMVQTTDGFEPDFENTRWLSITNERHHQITDELTLVESNKLLRTITNPQNFNSLNTITMKDQKITGYLGKDFYFSNEGKTPLASFQIAETKNNETTWHNVKAFGKTAVEIASALGLSEKQIEKKEAQKFAAEKFDGVKKYTVEGPLQDEKPYKNKKDELVTPQAIHVKSLQLHKLHELSGVIAKAESKTTKSGKEYTALYVKNTIDRGGVPQTIDYNINVYKSINIPERKNPDGSDWSLTKGQPIAVKGELTTSFYLKDNEVQKGENTTAWNVDRTITLLHEQIQEKQASKEHSPDQELSL